MAEDENQFQRLQDKENEKVLSQAVAGLLEEVKKLTEGMNSLKKEMRSVREDLRNIDKLRPLRTKEEEAEKPVEGQQEIPQKPEEPGKQTV